MSEHDEQREPTTMDRRQAMGLQTMGRRSATKGWTPYRPQEGELPESWENSPAQSRWAIVVLIVGVAAVVALAWWMAGSI